MNNALPIYFWRNFLGHSPTWYKWVVVACLVINVIALHTVGSVVTGWLVLAEFIGTLVMALKCYPLQPGGLLAIEAVLLHLTDAASVYNEVVSGIPVILLMVFMVTAIYFLRELLQVTFTALLIRVRSHLALSVLFCVVAAVLSAFLDALTVTAVVITAAMGFYAVYHSVASGKRADEDHDITTDNEVGSLHHDDLNAFRGFLRGLVMHASVGTAMGGVMTQVGEPQNLLIAKQAGWNFHQFFLEVAPVSIPVFIAGVLTCVIVERLRLFGYGSELPDRVYQVLREHAAVMSSRRGPRERAQIWVQALVAIALILALVMHWAEVGLIGLLIIVLATTFTGVTDESRIGKAFEVSLPFTALLVVFFAVVAVIHDQQLFDPVSQYVLSLTGKAQLAMTFVATGVLSAVSDNVFVATVYISGIKASLLEGVIDQHNFERLAATINVGTNIMSVATPNGQAAFLFLLTSALAPLIRLSYARMLWMALPYTIVLTAVAFVATMWWL
jgi:NhaB family Na+:H+ antiporter